MVFYEVIDSFLSFTQFPNQTITYYVVAESQMMIDLYFMFHTPAQNFRSVKARIEQSERIRHRQVTSIQAKVFSALTKAMGSAPVSLGKI
jgi:hypothetical protein